MPIAKTKARIISSGTKALFSTSIEVYFPRSGNKISKIDLDRGIYTSIGSKPDREKKPSIEVKCRTEYWRIYKRILALFTRNPSLWDNEKVL